MKKITFFLSVILTSFLIVSIPIKAQEENDFNLMDWEQGELLDKSLLFDKINEFIFNDFVNPFNESLKKYNINILDTPIKIYDIEYTIADLTGFTISITIITSLFIFAIRLFKSILGVFDL